MNESDIKVHSTFLFPFYMGAYHKLYINNNNDRMFERTGGNAGYLHKAIK